MTGDSRDHSKLNTRQETTNSGNEGDNRDNINKQTIKEQLKTMITQ